MKKYQRSRRLLIQNGLGILVGLSSMSAVGINISPSSKDRKAHNCLNMGFINECKAVKAYWFKTFDTTPQEYLNGSIIGSLGEQGLHKQVLGEFRADNVIAVKGLVLSKTEAALVCVFYDRSCARFSL
jgi:hypothetical protein